MKPNHLKIALFSSLFAFNLSAQNAIKTRQKKLKLNYVAGFISNNNEKVQLVSTSDLEKLTTLSSSGTYENQVYYWNLNQTDLSTFTSEQRFFSNQTLARSVYFGFEFKDKTKNKFRENSNFRVGLNYFRNNNVGGVYSKTTSEQSLQNDYEVNTKETYTMLNSSKKIQVDLSSLYKINSKKRLSFYVGLGITLGRNFNAETNVDYTYERTYAGNNIDPMLNTSTSSTSFYTFRNKPSFLGSTYIPLGIDYRLGKIDPFLKMFHVFFEARPTARVTTYSEIKPSFASFINYGFGIKICRE